MDTCQYCQARLKPYHTSDDFEEFESLISPEPTGPTKGKSEPLFPDWLSSLRESGPAESEQKNAEHPLDEGDTGEFLKPDETANLPGWILSAGASEPEESDDNWRTAQFELDQILSSTEPTIPQEEAEPLQAEAENEPLEFGQELDASTSEGALPDWMLEFLSEKANHAPLPASEPDSQQNVEEPPAELPVEQEVEFVPSAPLPVEEPHQSEVEFSLGDEEIFTDTDLPDWLNEISAEDVPAELPAPTKEEEAEKDLTSADLPAWLTAVRSVPRWRRCLPKMHNRRQLPKV